MADKVVSLLCSLPGMPKEDYEPPEQRRVYTIMSLEEHANGKRSHWAELEITGMSCLHDLFEPLRVFFFHMVVFTKPRVFDMLLCFLLCSSPSL